MGGAIHTGIRKAASLDTNIRMAKAAAVTHGYEAVRSRLDEMKAYPWVHHFPSDGCGCVVCECDRAITNDLVIAKIKKRVTAGIPFQAEPAQLVEPRSRW